MPNTELIASIRSDIKRLEALPVPASGAMMDHRKSLIAHLKSEVTRMEAEDKADCICDGITPAATEATSKHHYTSCPKYFETAETPTPSKTAAEPTRFQYLISVQKSSGATDDHSALLSVKEMEEVEIELRGLQDEEIIESFIIDDVPEETYKIEKIMNWIGEIRKEADDDLVDNPDEERAE